MPGLLGFPNLSDRAARSGIAGEEELKMEGGGSRIEDCEGSAGSLSFLLDPPSSILDPPSDSGYNRCMKL
jgi:hypothetical protein